jgi:hypothetical protein
MSELLQSLVSINEMKEMDLLGSLKSEVDEHVQWLPPMMVQNHMSSETSEDNIISPLSLFYCSDSYSWEALGSRCPVGVNRMEFCRTVLKTLIHIQSEPICSCDPYMLCTHKLCEAEAMVILYYLLQENNQREEEVYAYDYSMGTKKKGDMWTFYNAKRTLKKDAKGTTYKDATSTKPYVSEPVRMSKRKERAISFSQDRIDSNDPNEKDLVHNDMELDETSDSSEDGGSSCVLKLLQEPCMAQLRSKPEKNYRIRPPPKIGVVGTFDPHFHKLVCILVDSKTGKEVLCGGMSVLEGNVLDLNNRRLFVNHIATFPELRVMVKPSLMGTSNGHLRFRFQLVKCTGRKIRYIDSPFLVTTTDITVYSNYTQMSKFEKEVFINANQKRKNPTASPCTSTLDDVSSTQSLSET